MHVHTCSAHVLLFSSQLQCKLASQHMLLDPAMAAVQLLKPLQRPYLTETACREGNTALHLACQSNQLKVIEVLLQWGARANMTNASGFAPVSSETLKCILIWLLHVTVLNMQYTLSAATSLPFDAVTVHCFCRLLVNQSPAELLRMAQAAMVAMP